MERRYSAEQSMALNEAFEVLRDPLSRAEYLLELAGHAIDANGLTIDDPELLAEALAAREDLADALSSGEVARLMAANTVSGNACRADLSARIAAEDWTGAARAARRLRYHAKLDDEARRRTLAMGAMRA
jgi:molecular chaperone HscB